MNFKSLGEAKLSVVTDALHGCGAGYLDRALATHGVDVQALRTDRDVLFDGSGPDVSEENLRPLRDAVLAKKAAVGLATDGDADRFGILDSDGTWMQPNHILGLLYDYLVETRGWKMPAARSVATSHLMDAVARHYGTTVFQTPVGFKYIGELIEQDKIAIGGEESAGLTIRGHVPEKDGILACLLVAEMMAVRRASLARAVARAVQTRGPRILAAAHESSLARRCKIENGEPAEVRFLDISGTARQEPGPHRRFENGVRRRILGPAAAFRHRAAAASLHRGRDAQGVVENRKRNASLGDGLSAGSEGMMTLKQIREISPSEVGAYLRRNVRQILGLALFALLVHDVFGPHGFIAMRRTQKEIEQIREQIGKMNEENKSLGRAGQLAEDRSQSHRTHRARRNGPGASRRNDFQTSRLSQARRPAKIDFENL